MFTMIRNLIFAFALCGHCTTSYFASSRLRGPCRALLSSRTTRDATHNDARNQNNRITIPQRKVFATTHLKAQQNEHDDNATINGSTSKATVKLPAIPTRCSSRDAASIIKNSTASDGLLIITCDASGRGGGSKHDGIASILRMCHGVTSAASSSSEEFQCLKDLIDVTARRTVPSRKSSEVAAISLGIKRALRIIPPEMRKCILILSDSEFALDFYCGNQNNNSNGVMMSSHQSMPLFKKGNTTNKSSRSSNGKPGKRKGTASSSKWKKQKTQSMTLRDDAHRRALYLLMQDTPTGILFSKIRSSSRGVGVSSSSGSSSSGVDNNAEDEEESGSLSWDGTGFVDHDAADYLSSITRSSVNRYDYSELDPTTMELDRLPFRTVEALGDDDLEWLVNSESDQATSSADNGQNSTSDFWRTIAVEGPDAREDRRKRNECRKNRIHGMLGSSTLNLC